MINKYINIETKALVDLSKKLRDMRGKQYPTVVRQTLNDIAFNTKKTSLLVSAKKEFKGRVPHFIKWSSTFVSAKGSDISKMVAGVGILRKTSSEIGNTRATDNLGKFEYGGKQTEDKIFELPDARQGKKWDRRVNPKFAVKRNIIQKIGKTPIKTTRGKTFIKSVNEKMKKGIVSKPILIKNNIFLVSRTPQDRRKYKFILLYHKNNGKNHTAEKTMFIHKAIHIQVRFKMQDYFRKNALKKIKL